MSNLDVKMTKSCEELDLPQTVGLAPTVSDRFLDGTSFEDHTLPRPVGCTLPWPVGPAGLQPL